MVHMLPLEARAVCVEARTLAGGRAATSEGTMPAELVPVLEGTAEKPPRTCFQKRRQIPTKVGEVGVFISCSQNFLVPEIKKIWFLKKKTSMGSGYTKNSGRNPP